jgi:hypothetical protein
MLTPEVVMTILFGLKSAHGATEVQLRGSSVFPQDLKVSVNGALADVGYNLSDLIVYLVSRRMRPCVSQKSEDCLPLFGLPSHISHTSSQ